MASELSKFIDDELQKVDTAEERERLISKLRVRTSAKDSGNASRSVPNWQDQLLPRKRLLIIGLCTFFLIAIATVAITKGSNSSRGKDLEMDRSSEYAFDQDQAASLIDNTYPIPEEPSSEVMERQGEIPPPGREQGVDSNAPGSPTTNIRDDEGSSVPFERSSGDALDDMPPIPPSHKRSPAAMSPRKMGPSAPSTTPASASSRGHQPASTGSSGAESLAAGDEQLDFSEDSRRAIGLAPSPELSEQQAYDKATEQYEAEVERAQQEAADIESTRDPADMATISDPVFGHSAEERTESERELENELAGGSSEQHSHAAHENPADAAEAMAEAEDAVEAEEAAMLAERNEMAAEEARAEGLDDTPPAADEYEG